MPLNFAATRRVEFRDTDAAGIMHFSAFFPMMEEVEHEFWRSKGLRILDHRPEGLLTWPRVAARCDYHSPARFDDVLDIQLAVARVGKKSVTYAFEFSHDGRRVASGEIVAVACIVEPGETPRSVAIPEEIIKKLGA